MGHPVDDEIYHSHFLTILEYFVSLKRYASDSGLSSEMENSSEMTRIEPSTEIKSEWTKRRSEREGRNESENDNAAAVASFLLRFNPTHSAASIADGLFVEGGRKWGLRYLPSFLRLSLLPSLELASVRMLFIGKLLKESVGQVLCRY